MDYLMPQDPIVSLMESSAVCISKGGSWCFLGFLYPGGVKLATWHDSLEVRSGGEEGYGIDPHVVDV